METIYRTFFERAKDAVIIFDDEGLIMAANPKAEEIFGYANGKLLNMNILDLILPEFQFDFILRYKSILTNDESNKDPDFFFYRYLQKQNTGAVKHLYAKSYKI